MTTTRDELESRLTSLFQEQAGATPVPPADWTEVRPLATPPGPSRRPVLAAAATAVAVLAAVVTLGGGDTARVRTGPADDAEAAGPATTAVTHAGFHADTRQVRLHAGAVVIEAGGRRFVTAAPITAHSDPGDATSTTLELTWQEHGVEMRLFIYFTSDGRDWWSDEIRTYDGGSPGEWITYEGEFFRRPLGTAFVGDFEVSQPAPGTGRVHLAGAQLEAFRRSPSCDGATTPLVLDPGTSPIRIPGHGVATGYGVAVRLLDAASCAVLPDQDRYVYAWRSRDPDVVSVDTSFQPPEHGGRHADLTAARPGHASVHVAATDPDTGVVVAELELPVEVGDAAMPTIPTTRPAPGEGQGPVLQSVTADLGAGTITVTFDQAVHLGTDPLAAMYLVVYGADPACTTPAGNSHRVMHGDGSATLTLDATSLARPTSYITLAPGFVTGASGAANAPVGCMPVATS